MLAARGRDKQDVGCSQSQKSCRKETSVAISNLPLPRPVQTLRLLLGKESQARSWPAAPSVQALPLFLPRSPPSAVCIPWHPRSNRSSPAEAPTSFCAHLVNLWTPSQNNIFKYGYQNHRIIKETNYIQIKLPKYFKMCYLQTLLIHETIR